MSIRVSTTFLAHDGGTKFYEMVLLESQATDRAVLIKRWGKNEFADTGNGETMDQSGTPAECKKEFDSVFKSKSKVRNGGKYEAAVLNKGFHRISNVGSHMLPEILSVARKHYATGGIPWEIERAFENEEALVARAQGATPLPPATPAPTPITKSKTEAYAEWGSF